MNKIAFLLIYMFACQTLVGCATNPMVSPYVNPEEGKVFKYGNFCGPSYPKFSEKYSTDITFSGLLSREAKILSTSPVDDIDRACRAHDICYDFFGHDSSRCDATLSLLLRDNYAPEKNFVSHSGTGCETLAYEIVSGVTTLKPFGITLQGKALSTALKSPAIAIDLMFKGLSATNMMLGSWPEEGQCYIRINERSLNRLVINETAGAFANEVCYIPSTFRILKTPQMNLTCKEDVKSVMKNSFELSDFFWRENQGRPSRALNQRSLKKSRECIRSIYTDLYNRDLSKYKRRKLLKQCDPKTNGD